jgi:hypothetical protein
VTQPFPPVSQHRIEIWAKVSCKIPKRVSQLTKDGQLLPLDTLAGIAEDNRTSEVSANQHAVVI